MRILKQRKTEGGRRLGAVRHARNAERVKIHVTKGDTVKVMRGEDKGKTGKVIKVFPKTGRVTVEGVNIVKRHRKARRPEEQSGIVEMAAPIHASNVMPLDPKSGEATRVRTRIDEDASEAKLSRRKERISVKSGDAMPHNR